MNPSEKDPVSLDEKIALIRKKNEKIIQRNQLIAKEIELAKKHNAMVDVCAPKTFEDDKPTLYSDTIQKSHKEMKRTVPDVRKVNYKPKYSNTKEDAAWRAERNEIDRERIRRQRADSGWKREWDADKNDPDDEFLKNSFDRRGYSKESSHTRPSQNQSVSVERSEFPVSTRQNYYKSKQSDISMERSEFPVSTHQNQYKSKQSDISVERSKSAVPTCQSQCKSQQSDSLLEKSESSVPPQRQSRGRGRPVVLADKSKITQGLRRVDNVEPPKVKEKAPLKKRVSWDGDNDLIESRRISLKDDRLKNIKVKVNVIDNNSKNRSIEVAEKEGLLIKPESALKFNERTSFNIKDCVAKVSSVKPRVNFHAIKDAAPLSKPKDSSSAKIAPKPIIINRKEVARHVPGAASPVTATERSSKDEERSSKNEKDTSDDEEWEDVSGEEWESVSDEE